MNISLGRTNNTPKRSTFGIKLLLTMMISGALFFFVGIFVLNDMRIDEGWSRTQGTVVDVQTRSTTDSTTYVPTLEYSVESNTYRVTSNSGFASYPVKGAQYEVAYNPTNPGQAKVVTKSGSNWWVYLVIAVGVAVFFFGPFQFIRSLKRTDKIESIISSGRKVQGILTDVRSAGQNNQVAMYRIVVTATDTDGSVKNFVSDAIDGIAGLAIADFGNTVVPIDVYIDPLNSENYYVDIADLPQLTPQSINDLIAKAVSGRGPIQESLVDRPSSPAQQSSNEPPQQPPTA